MTFKVTLKRGLGGPYKIEAEDETEARKAGLAKYRFENGSVETLSFLPIDQVVDTVTPME